MSINSAIFFLESNTYVSWLVFALDILAAIIVYLTSGDLRMSYKYYILHFVSWLCIFSHPPDQLLGLLTLLGLLLRIWPMWVSCLWAKYQQKGAILSLALILNGGMSVVWDLAKNLHTMKFIFASGVDVLSEHLVFDLPDLGLLVTVPQIAYFSGLAMFAYYALKLLRIKQFTDVALYIYQSQLGLFIAMIVQMMYLSGFELMWHVATWSNWFRLIIPWFVSVVCIQIDRNKESLYAATAHADALKINHTQTLLRQFNGNLFKFICGAGWLWAILIAVLSFYLSFTGIFWYFSFFNESYTSLLSILMHNLLLIGLGLIGIFTALWWTVFAYQSFALLKFTSWKYVDRYILLFLLGAGLMCFHLFNVDALWHGLVADGLYKKNIFYALQGQHLYQWQQLYFVAAAFALIVLQALWYWHTYLEYAVQYCVKKCKKLASCIYKLAVGVNNIVVPWCKFFVYVICKLCQMIIYRVVLCAHNGSVIKPGSAVFFIMVCWSAMLLLCYS